MNINAKLPNSKDHTWNQLHNWCCRAMAFNCIIRMSKLLSLWVQISKMFTRTQIDQDHHLRHQIFKISFHDFQKMKTLFQSFYQYWREVIYNRYFCFDSLSTPYVCIVWKLLKCFLGNVQFFFWGRNVLKNAHAHTF